MICQSDDSTDLTTLERSRQDESSLLHSDPSHAELQRCSTPCDDEVPSDAAAAADDDDGGCDAFVQTEITCDEGVLCSVFVSCECRCIFEFVL